MGTMRLDNMMEPSTLVDDGQSGDPLRVDIMPCEPLVSL